MAEIKTSNMKPIKIKLPFGLNENNILVHIADVKRGKKCYCVCPSCRSPLIAAKGSKKQHHFKHAFDNECKSGLESAVHLAAKKMIMERKQITFSKCVSIASGTDSRGIEHKEQKIIVEDGMVVRFDSVEEETELHGMKADILAKMRNKLLIIEIFYRHKVEEEKLVKIVKADISAIEINLSDLRPEDVMDWEAFWLYLNDPHRVQWLYNAKAQSVNQELKEQVARAIQQKEEGYKEEQIKKQMKAQRERRQLLQALDEVKTLSSKESIEKLKQKAEMHPVWRCNAKKLPFSWKELPDFVNADIPNGDWIFGCDRRIWQTAIYKVFILWNAKPFSVKNIDNWLQNKVGCKVLRSIKVMGIYGNRYPQLLPVEINGNPPSSWNTLRAYFNDLCDLGMLKFSGYDYHNPGNAWFCVIDKKTKP